jgi:hypothetical protein
MPADAGVRERLATISRRVQADPGTARAARLIAELASRSAEELPTLA